MSRLTYKSGGAVQIRMYHVLSPRDWLVHIRHSQWRTIRSFAQGGEHTRCINSRIVCQEAYFRAEPNGAEMPFSGGCALELTCIACIVRAGEDWLLEQID